MQRLWDRLTSSTRDDARAQIAALSDEAVLAFWAWNDRCAAEAIGEATTADDRAALAADLRQTLVHDVLAEIGG
jgi:hypothetical protein